jgi:hypothetical protein
MNQEELIDAVIERAEQACRYVFKSQNFNFTSEDNEYGMGFELGCQVCENAIRSHVMRHIKEDIKMTIHAPDS